MCSPKFCVILAIAAFCIHTPKKNYKPEYLRKAINQILTSTEKSEVIEMIERNIYWKWMANQEPQSIERLPLQVLLQVEGDLRSIKWVRSKTFSCTMKSTKVSEEVSSDYHNFCSSLRPVSQFIVSQFIVFGHRPSQNYLKHQLNKINKYK